MPSENNVNSFHTYQQLLKLLFPTSLTMLCTLNFHFYQSKMEMGILLVFLFAGIMNTGINGHFPSLHYEKTLLKKSFSNWKMKKISCRWKISITVLTEQDMCRLWKLPFNRLLIYKKKDIFHCRDRAVTTFPSDLN